MPDIHYVTIKVEVKDCADIQEIVSEMDYHLVHSDILETEIISVSDEHECYAGDLMSVK